MDVLLVQRFREFDLIAVLQTGLDRAIMLAARHPKLDALDEHRQPNYDRFEEIELKMREEDL
jgi:hypothetical protein